MATYGNTNRDIAGNAIYAPIPCTNMFSSTLTNGAATTLTVPSTHDNWLVS